MKKNLLLFLLFTLILCISGCGKRKETPYETATREFINNIKDCANRINNTDVNAENSKETLLSYLDEMNKYFSDYSEVTVPDEFESNANLSISASECMNEAVMLYHQAFEAEVFDEALFNSATAQYNTALTYVQYIGSVFMNIDPTKESTF